MTSEFIFFNTSYELFFLSSSFKLILFFLFESNNKQREGKITKPKGKKKYGGNKSDVRSPSVK